VVAEAERLETLLRERQPRDRVESQLAALDAPLCALIAALEQQLPSEAQDGPATAVDPEKLRGVCARLEALLADDNAEAGDVMDENGELLKAAFPAHFARIDEAIRGFDFEGALAALRAAAESTTQRNGAHA
jgi:two-component system, sensor histidine kinase and response regulator